MSNAMDVVDLHLLPVVAAVRGVSSRGGDSVYLGITRLRGRSVFVGCRMQYVGHVSL